MIEFDKENKKIVLSAISALKEKPEQEVREYLDKHKLDRVSVEEIMNADTGAIDSSDFPIFEINEEQHTNQQDNS